MFNIGDSVSGKDFIGRDEDVKELIFHIKCKENVRVQGLPRIGKSSLVKEALYRIEHDPSLVGGILPYFFQFSFTHDSNDRELLFENLFVFLKNCLKDINVSEQSDAIDLKYSIAEIKKNLNKKIVSYYDCLIICNIIHKYTNRVLWLVLDEMDYAGICLGSYIDKIRELIDNSNGCVRSINVSRHSLRDIFPLGGPGSNYSGIVIMGINVIGYNDNDMELIKQQAELYCGELSDNMWLQIKHYAGNIPMLIEYFSNEIEKYSCTDIEEVYSKIKYSLDEYYKVLYDTLCDMRMYDDYIAVLNGVSPKTDKLKIYGLVEDNIPTIPYMSEFINGTPVLLDQQLVRMYLRMQNDVEELLKEGKEVSNRLLGNDERNRQGINDCITVLNAMKAKIAYVGSLNNLQLSCNDRICDIVDSGISEKEINAFSQYCSRFKNRLESVSIV